MSDSEALFGEDEESLILGGQYVEKRDTEEGSDDEFVKSQAQAQEEEQEQEQNSQGDEEEEEEEEDRSSRKKNKRIKKKSRSKNYDDDENNNNEEDGGDDDSSKRKKKYYEDDDEGEEYEEKKEVIRPPIELQHIDTEPLPPSRVMKLKLLNILGIQPKPFDRDMFEADEGLDNPETSKSKFNIESVIRWRWTLDDNGRPTKESNTRLVRWSDGSAHLFIGSEVLEIKEQDLNSDQFYVYSQQDKFIECERKINSKLSIIPTNIRSKVHQRLSESVSKYSSKGSKIKSIHTHLDPEKEKEKREKLEAEKLRKERMEAEKKGQSMTSQFLEGGDDEELDSYRNEGDNFIDDSEVLSDEDGDYEEEEEEEEDDYSEDSDGEYIEKKFTKSSSSSKKKRDREDPSKLMNIKRSGNNSSSRKKIEKDVFGEDDEDDEPVVSKKPKKRIFDSEDDE